MAPIFAAKERRDEFRESEAESEGDPLAYAARAAHSDASESAAMFLVK